MRHMTGVFIFLEMCLKMLYKDSADLDTKE